MVDITAKAILDSESSNGGENSRLITMLTRYPKFVHGEHLRHRSMSFSVSSSRAIPVSKNIVEAYNDESRASPVWWGREQKGMSSGDELENIDRHHPENGGYYNELEQAKTYWKEAAAYAVGYAEKLQGIGVHKSIVNRLMEPFLHVNVLVSGTTPGWMNFFGLRLDKAAQPEIRVLAEECWKVWNDSKPQVLNPGSWHTPFVQQEDLDYWLNIMRVSAGREIMPTELMSDNPINLTIKTSIARCARLSYQSFETGRRSTIEEDLALYERLVGSSPIHASPAEHQATPATRTTLSYPHNKWAEWDDGHLCGNFGPGWIQFRKTLPNEAVAPLPKGY